MAIFIALFFQVIFVFFAMAINVGLVIHDKINLQNAVDMAAYYGAAKQAEVLNQIAHVNYQMRQNYKLFAWKYRVLGTLGNVNNPLNQVYSGPNTNLLPEDTSFDPNAPPPTPPDKITPSVCVAHSYFKEVQDIDPNAATVCRLNDFNLPAIPSIAPPTGFVPGSGSLPNTLNFIQGQLNKFCLEAGIFNWYYAARALVHFRTEGMARKNMIWRLANNLNQSDPQDLRGESIRTGAQNTFEKNLTNTNLGSIQNGSGQFQYMNSLSVGQCQDPAFWLPEIKINPLIFYSDWAIDGASNCQPAQALPNQIGLMTGRPTYAGSDNLPSAFQYSTFAASANGALAQSLIPHWQTEPASPGSGPSYRSSVGYEKNPWCMVYTGIQAQTMVRKPFDPTGQGVVLQARGYAKPFGGRIGPWYAKQWPRGGGTSYATSRDQMVDPLLPSRDITGRAANPFNDVVNYSRYPGDPSGIGSFRAMSAMRAAFKQQVSHSAPTNPSPLAFGNWDSTGSMGSLIATGDGLPRVANLTSGSVPPRTRPFEIAAVAPDLFDITYYSIDPRYHRYYFSPRATNSAGGLSGIQPIFDIGSSKDGFTYGSVVSSVGFGVREQIELAANPDPATGTYNPDYEPVTRNWMHLLNSWHQEGVVTFGIDPARFGVCADAVTNPEYPNPSDCIRGGRVGYSVKLISRDFLESSSFQIGGGASTGALLNPPSSNGF